jgi:predicted DNA-binding protein YlxM (UPF0122 family)
MEITEKNNLWKIIHSIFLSKSTRLYNRYGKSFSVELEIWQQQLLKMRSEGANQNSPTRLLVVKNDKKIFICECRVKGVTGEGALLLDPIKITIREETEEDNREYQDPSLYVTSIISLADITVFLGDDHIKELVKNHSRRLNHLFDFYQVYLSDKQDERIRLMRAFDMPIIILNREDSNSAPDFAVPHSEYDKSIKSDKMLPEYKAEISVPIKYRQYIIIGYVQVFSRSRLDLNSYNLVNLVASSIKKEISDYRNYEESKEFCRVTAFTSTEITFLHSMNKHFSRIFRIGSQILFNIAVKTVRASIKNILPLDRSFSVCCEFHNITLDQLEKIEELVELSGLNTEIS